VLLQLKSVRVSAWPDGNSYLNLSFALAFYFRDTPLTSKFGLKPASFGIFDFFSRAIGDEFC
jgi:hypothetical protein